MRSLKDEWLDVLETKFSIIVDKLREEKTRRLYKDKIETLQAQIRYL